MKNTSKPKVKEVKAEESVAKTLASIYETGYISRKRLVWMSLLKGFMTGFAGVLGATIGIAILLGVLTRFEEAPLIGDFAKKMYQTITQEEPTSNRE